MNYTHNGYELVEVAINPEYITPDTYSYLEAPRMVNGKEYRHWHRYFHAFMYQGLSKERWN